MLGLTLEVIMTEDSNFMWSMSKSLLGLIIVNEGEYEEIKNRAIEKVVKNAEERRKVQEAFHMFMAGVSKSFDNNNKDNFGLKFSELRQSIASLYC